MRDKYREFEWDEFNSGKNLQKHGVSDLEIEQVFGNPYVIIRHKRFPDRRIVLGMTMGDDIFFHLFSICQKHCRPIHARDMEKHEKQAYLKAIGSKRR